MLWTTPSGFGRRPLVVVEDHLQHVSELLASLAEGDPSIAASTTVLCLDRAGPDTTHAVTRWLDAHPALQVAARLEPGTGEGRRSRLATLDPTLFGDANRFCRTLAGLLRPGGLLLQDIQLSTLGFIPPERWWESIVLASTVRGMFAENPPTCRFLSNKRGYEATFGRDLVDSGFHPRDVMDKRELRETVVPVVRSYLARAFPLKLELAGAGVDVAVAKTDEDRREVEGEVDLVAWCGASVEIGGRLVAAERSVSLKPGSQEAATWLELVADRFRGGAGVEVLEVGRRVAPEGAGRAEITNQAARHIHGLRARLRDGAAILTAHHAYRLADGLVVGRVTPR